MKNTIVQVLLPFPFDAAFDYRVPEGFNIEIGSFVIVPFGNRKTSGVVWSIEKSHTPQNKLKDIISVSDVPPMQKNLRKFIKWISGYSLYPIGSVLAMTINIMQALEKPKPDIGYKLGDTDNIKLTESRKKVIEYMENKAPLKAVDIASAACVGDGVVRGMIKTNILIPVKLHNASVTPKYCNAAKAPVTLSGEQYKASSSLKAYVAAHKYKTIVLDGVTGSGKTEVYFEAIEEALITNKQTLVLLPEIVLTTQFVTRFEKRFGFSPTQWHSSLTQKQRKDNWRAIANGDAKIVAGARSALLLPYKNLGLIVVDEEHEGSFKQEEGVIYHARDMAVVRANIEDIPIILASASPSIETVANINNGKFTRLHLPNRHGTATMPDILAIDMRKEKLDSSHWLSIPLKKALDDNFASGEQSLLYLNRRGYAPLTLCRTCGFRFQCPDCTAWLVSHKYPDSLQCHHCGYTSIIPQKCPSCEDEESFASCGPGVERLEEEVREFLPDAIIAVMTSDKINSAKKSEEMIKDIEEGKIDIIIGTQMVAKGHHFPNLTLVGAVDADLGLDGGDMRAAERCFQILHQVSGRAGREHLKGRAIIQSYMPDNMIMEALISGNRDDFIDKELIRRKEAHMPPFSRMAALIVSHKDEAIAKKTSTDLAKSIPSANGVRILGPAPAPLFLLRGKYRYRFLAITDRNINIQKMIKAWLASLSTPSSVSIKVDIDPYSFV